MSIKPLLRFSFARFAFPVFAQLLRLIVRPRILPEQPRIDANVPVCYIAESDALSNVLILQQACRQHNLRPPLSELALDTTATIRRLIALKSLRGFVVRRPNMRAHLTLLARLVQAVEEDTSALDLQLVPVSIFLGRAPDKEAGWFKILFSENWPIAGRLRRLIAMLIHGRNTIVQFSEPISVRQVLAENLGSARTVRKISRVLRVHFRRTRTAVIGPDLSHRRTMVDQILRSRSVRAAIELEARKKNQTLARARRRARAYTREIAADYSYPVVRILSHALSWFWNRIYNGIQVNHLDRFQALPKGAEIVYVPCHRSYIDYLLVSYLVYHHGMAVPHTAAGINLNMPVVGPILRRAGAFFLRRSFRSNALYSAVFYEYVDSIFAKGVPLEYFIEGGRSRTGRSLAPRTGMLAITLRSFLRHPERPVVFVPVHIGYERLVEGDAYLGELSGGKKKKETLSGLVRSFRIAREKFGQAHVSFGHPIELSQHFDRYHATWRQELADPDYRPQWLPTAVSDLAQQIMTHINDAAYVSPMNLLSLALLAAPRHALGEEDLVAQIDIIRTLARRVPYSDSVTISDMPTAEIVRYALSMKVVQRQNHELGDVILCDDTTAWLISYFRNNILHLTAAWSWCACAFLNNVSFRRRSLLRIGRVIFPFLKTELFLNQNVEGFEADCGRCIAAFIDLGLLQESESGWLKRARGGSPEALQLTMLSHGIFPSLERYYITVALLVKNGSGRLNSSELERLCQLTAQRLSMIYTFDTPEFFDRALFKDFIRALRTSGVLDTDDEGCLIFDRHLENVIEDAKTILSKEVRHTIWRLSPKPDVSKDLEAA